jgi:hypothetical protein
MASIAYYQRALKGQLGQGHKILSNAWDREQIESACRQSGYHWRDRIWNPLQTVWTFLLQVLYVGSSCRAAVAMTLGQRAAAGASSSGSPDPSGYCQARRRLPRSVFRRGVTATGQKLQERIADRHLWCGRRL